MTASADKGALRILNLEPRGYSEEARRNLLALGDLVEKALTRSDLLEILPDFDVLIVRLNNQIDRQVIGAGKRLKAIVSATTGLDHIDVDYARRRGVEVISLKGEVAFLRTISATAEHTWALLLCLLRRLVPAADSVIRGEWDRDAFRGHELYGKKLGIVGLGRLGAKVARYGLAFDMQVGAYDPGSEGWGPDIWRAPSMEALLAWSDVVSLHVPLNESTRKMIGPRELDRLSPGAVLINTSRGQIIDEDALVDRLHAKALSGAAVDVIADERDPVKRTASPLLAYARENNNVIISPHIGGATHESMARTEAFIVAKLKAYLVATGKIEAF